MQSRNHIFLGVDWFVSGLYVMILRAQFQNIVLPRVARSDPPALRAFVIRAAALGPCPWPIEITLILEP